MPKCEPIIWVFEARFVISSAANGKIQMRSAWCRLRPPCRFRPNGQQQHVVVGRSLSLHSAIDMKAARVAFQLAGRRAAMVLAAGSALAAVDARAEGRPRDAHAMVAQQPRHWGPWPELKRAAPPLPQCADLQQLYRVDSVIGRGGFGLVHQGRDKKSDAPVAIKRVCKQSTSKAKFLQEVEILRAMSCHDNVVTLCEAFETTDAYVLVTELVDGEELFDHLVNHGVFSERRAQSLVREVASTLAYLHENGVVHGDLKPENILVTRDVSQMRLIDFGQSFREHIVTERARSLRSGVATIAYAAPEVIRATTSDKSLSTGYAIDMWGLGVILFILLCGFHPFDPDNDAADSELAQRIASGAFDTESPEWKELPSSARNLIEHLLQVDPLRRLSASEVLSHEWLATNSAV